MRAWARGLAVWLGLVGLTLALLAGGQAMAVDFEKAIPEEYRVGGFALGCQAYSFNKYSFFEAIDKTRQTGCRLIEAYPGQRLSPEIATPFSHDAPDEVLEQARKKLDEAGVKLVAYGVVGLGNDEAANRKVFEFAKKMGILVITSEPSEDALDRIAKMSREYGIPVAMHNHPSRPDNPGYKHWSPDFVLQCSKGRQGVIGSCADTGHWMRSEVNPLDAVKQLEGNIISMHIKDLNKFGRPGEHDVPFGTGKANMAAILDEITRQGFRGPMSIEYEYNWTTSVPEIAQCVGFVRGYGQALQKK